MLLGTFKKTETNGFTGTIRTLTLALDLAIEPNKEKKTDKAPDYRVTAGDLEIGGGWMRKSAADNAYLSVTLDDPALPAPIDCALVKSGIEHGYNLVWTRRTRKAKPNGTPADF
jgi:uncharacterized protein (DUF736 family)